MYDNNYNKKVSKRKIKFVNFKKEQFFTSWCRIVNLLGEKLLFHNKWHYFATSN